MLIQNCSNISLYIISVQCRTFFLLNCEQRTKYNCIFRHKIRGKRWPTLPSSLLAPWLLNLLSILSKPLNVLSQPAVVTRSRPHSTQLEDHHMPPPPAPARSMSPTPPRRNQSARLTQKPITVPVVRRPVVPPRDWSRCRVASLLSSFLTQVFRVVMEARRKTIRKVQSICIPF